MKLVLAAAVASVLAAPFGFAAEMPNSHGINALTQNALSFNALTFNALTFNSLTFNALTSNALASNSLAATGTVRDVWTLVPTGITLASGVSLALPN